MAVATPAAAPFRCICCAASGLTHRPSRCQAFAAANTELLAFLTYLPAERVEAAKRQVAAENDANVREYEKAYNGEQLLNQPKK